MSPGSQPGTILWYRLDSDRGMVRADSGRQYFINRNSGVSDLVQGLRVLLREIEGSGNPTKVQLSLPEGARQVIPLETPSKPVSSPKPRRKPTTKLSGSASPRTRKAKTPKGVVKRVKRAGEALERGIPVLHPTHGQGFVVMSTPKIARVKFAGEERSVRVGDLQVLETS